MGGFRCIETKAHILVKTTRDSWQGDVRHPYNHGNRGCAILPLGLSLRQIIKMILIEI
jgi:hypothetical protein